MQIDTWFSTLILSENIYRVDLKPLIDRCFEVEKNNPRTRLDIETYNTIDVYDVQHDEVFTELLEIIKYKVKQFAGVYGIEDCEFEKIESWINISRKGDFQEFHIHPKSHFSAVFYLLAPDNCGDIVFQRGESMLPLPRASKENSYNLSMVTYKAEQYKLLVFPSSLKHLVRKSNSNDTRISIAINFKLKG